MDRQIYEVSLPAVTTVDPGRWRMMKGCLEMDDRIDAIREAAHAAVGYFHSGHRGAISLNRQNVSLAARDSQIVESFTQQNVQRRILSLYAAGHAKRMAGAATTEFGFDDCDEQAMGWCWVLNESELMMTSKSASMVREHWSHIERLAGELIRWRSLNADEVGYILDDDVETLATYRHLIGRVS